MLRDLTLLFKPCCCHGAARLIRAAESKSTEWAAATHMYTERMPDWLPVSALTPGPPGSKGVVGAAAAVVAVGGVNLYAERERR